MRPVHHSSGKTSRWSCFSFSPSIGMGTPAIMSGIVAGLNASVNLLIRQLVFFIASINTGETPRPLSQLILVFLAVSAPLR